mgnify:CR=1 FL=1|jgi:hypothetical protein
MLDSLEMEKDMEKAACILMEKQKSQIGKMMFLSRLCEKLKIIIHIININKYHYHIILRRQNTVAKSSIKGRITDIAMPSELS